MLDTRAQAPGGQHQPLADLTCCLVHFESANETITETGLAGEGDDGIYIVFRTNEFSTDTPIETLAAEANLNARGSWAVAAK